MSSDKKYILILPWFGDTPMWWEYFVQSMLANAGIMFLIVSDCLEIQSAPSNVLIVRMSLEDAKHLAEHKLQTPVALDRPMKLCDLRPMYGHIFEGYLRECEFWGYGDIDVIYGQLSKWLANAREENADIVSFHKLWLSGSLCFVRNTDGLRYLYQMCPKWREVIKDPRNLFFDELGGGFYRQRAAGVPIRDLPAVYGSFTLLVHEAERKGEVRVSVQGPIRERLTFQNPLRWTPSGLCDVKTGEEIAYLHLLGDKGRFFRCSLRQHPSERFYINPTGFWSDTQYGSLSQRASSAMRIAGGVARYAARKAVKYMRRRNR